MIATLRSLSAVIRRVQNATAIRTRSSVLRPIESIHHLWPEGAGGVIEIVGTTKEPGVLKVTSATQRIRNTMVSLKTSHTAAASPMGVQMIASTMCLKYGVMTN
jgi:hypothetical protein